MNRWVFITYISSSKNCSCCSFVIFFHAFFLHRFKFFLVPVLVVSTSISSISIFSLLVIIRSTSVIISSVFGHLFSRPSLTAKYYRLGCHISTKDIKLTSIIQNKSQSFNATCPFQIYISLPMTTVTLSKHCPYLI